jgi:hypothetical protein
MFRSTPQALAIDHKLKSLGSGEGGRVARMAIKGRFESLIAEGFRDEQAPGGQAWAPRKPPTGAWPLLRLTGKMAKAFVVSVVGPRVTIANATTSEQGRPYPLFHQKGTRKMQSRKMVPDRTLSTRWRNEINKVVKLALEHLR